MVAYELPFPLALAHEWPPKGIALDTRAEQLHAFCCAFLPSLAHYETKFNLFCAPSKYPLESQEWFPVRKARHDAAFALAGVEAHLRAGETGEPQQWGSNRIRAIGAQWAGFPDQKSGIVNLDLDGKIPPLDVILALRIKGVFPLVISSSGRPGRYRALILLDRMLPHALVKKLMVRILESCSFAAKRGAIEIYPGNVNTRLPFGLGGCEVFDHALTSGRKLDTKALLSALFSLEPIDLEKLAPTVYTPAASKAKKPKAKKSDKPGDFAQIAAEARRCFHARIPQGEAINHCLDLFVRLKEAADLTRDPCAIEPYSGVKIEGIAPLVCDAYSFLDAANVPPAHLNPADIRALSVAVRQAAKTQGIREDRVGNMVLALLPLWKGALLSNRINDQGQPIVKLYHREWRAVMGHDYCEIRDALGLWSTETEYCPPWEAAPGESYSRTYAYTGPALSTVRRNSALASTWKRAIERAFS